MRLDQAARRCRQQRRDLGGARRLRPDGHLQRRVTAGRLEQPR